MDLEKLIALNNIVTKRAALRNVKYLQDAWAALGEHNYLEAKEQLSYLGKGSTALTVADIYLPKAYAERGLKNFDKCIDCAKYGLEWVTRGGSDGGVNAWKSVSSMKNSLYSLIGSVYYYDKDNMKKAEKFYRKAFNADRNDLDSLFYLINISAFNKDASEFNRYNNELKLKFNIKDDDHRESLYDFVNDDEGFLGKRKYYLRFLENLRVYGFIDDHTFYNKSGISPNSDNSPEREEIFKYIKKNQLNLAIDKALLSFKDEPEKFNSVMILFNNYNKLRMEVRNGIIDREKEQIGHNKIISGLIKLVSV